MAITGPRVQMPSVTAPVMVEGEGGQSLSQDHAQFLHQLQQIAFYSTRSGPTASRPTSTSNRWVGMNYFDTTLGKMVYLKIASTNVWVDGAGTVV